MVEWRAFVKLKKMPQLVEKVIQTFNKPLLFNPNFAFSLTPTK